MALGDRSRRLGAAAAIATAIAIPAEGLRQLPTPRIFALFKGAIRLSCEFLARGTDWCGRRFFVRPSAGCNSVVHYRNRHARLFSYFGKSHTIGSLVDDMSVSALCLPVGPCAVIRVIAKRIVFTFYRKIISVTRNQRPSVEALKFKPLNTDCYSLAAVSFVGCIPASAKHVAPAVVDSCSFHSMGCRPGSNGRSRPFTPARNAFPDSEIATNNRFLCSAGASAQPQGSTFWGIPYFLNNNPFPKVHAGHVNKSWVFHFFALSAKYD